MRIQHFHVKNIHQLARWQYSHVYSQATVLTCWCLNDSRLFRTAQRYASFRIKTAAQPIRSGDNIKADSDDDSSNGVNEGDSQYDQSRENSTPIFHDLPKSNTETKKTTAQPPYQRPTNVSHYDVLGVSTSATLKEIRQAYMQKARLLHPDLNHDDIHACDKFVDLQLAYQILSSPLTRNEYDMKLKPNRYDKREVVKSDTTEAYWKSQWDLETPAEKAARRQRYKDFATGDFQMPEGDYPDWKILPMKSFIAYFGSILIVMCVWDFYLAQPIAKDDPDDEYQTSDFRTAKYSDCYFNPFSGNWERLNHGTAAPTPQELLRYYEKLLGKIAINHLAYPSKELAQTKMERRNTLPPVVYRDLKSGKLFGLAEKSGVTFTYDELEIKTLPDCI